jgi:uncharacterized Zn-binding protein involved in type VI secretion
MSLPWIVKGDKTSHGGTVIEGDPTFETHGKPVALVGHMTTCPKCKGGPFPIATGAPDFVSNGRPVARHGDRTACGASLISGQFVSMWSAERSAATTAGTLPRQRPEIGQATPTGLTQARRGESIGPTLAESYGKRFLVTNSESGEPLANRKFIAVVGGSEREGTTDGDGYADIEAKPGESIELHVIFGAPKGQLIHQGR